MDNKVRCPICKREVRGKEVSSVQPGPEHAFLCPYWREDPEENSDHGLSMRMQTDIRRENAE
jgi:hypothetical protein